MHAKVRRLQAVQERPIVAKGEHPVFEDPRKSKDRRVANRPDLIPEDGCRRKSERRSDRINLGYWWMKRRYGGDNTTK